MIQTAETLMNLASQAAQSLSFSEGLKHAHELEKEAHELLAKAHSDVDASRKGLREGRKILRHTGSESATPRRV
jgi:hypothetical protein